MRATPGQALAAALFNVESIHQIHGHQCLCGFESHVSRDRTKHIIEITVAAVTGTVTDAVLEASTFVAQFRAEHTTEWAVQDAAGQHPPGPTTTSESDRDEMLAQIAQAKELGFDMVLIHRTVGHWTGLAP